MKVNVTNLGGGLTRLDIEPTCSCEPRVIPTHVADDIMRDVVKREKNGNGTSRWSRPVATRPCCPTFTPTTTWDRPLPTPRVESGFDAHIDRPNRSNYGGIPWAAEDAYRKDLAKYNRALSAVKECNWPCKEDLNGVPRGLSQHNPNPHTQMVGVPNYRNLSAPHACGCFGSTHSHGVCVDRNSEARINAALNALETLVNELF